MFLLGEPFPGIDITNCRLAKSAPLSDLRLGQPGTAPKPTKVVNDPLLPLLAGHLSKVISCPSLGPGRKQEQDFLRQFSVRPRVSFWALLQGEIRVRINPQQTSRIINLSWLNNTLWTDIVKQVTIFQIALAFSKRRMDFTKPISPSLNFPFFSQKIRMRNLDLKSLEYPPMWGNHKNIEYRAAGRKLKKADLIKATLVMLAEYVFNISGSH